MQVLLIIAGVILGICVVIAVIGLLWAIIENTYNYLKLNWRGLVSFLGILSIPAGIIVLLIYRQAGDTPAVRVAFGLCIAFFLLGIFVGRD